MTKSRNHSLFAQDIDLIISGLNLLNQGISIFDADLNLRIWNTQTAKLFSLPEELQRRGTPFADIMEFLALMGEYGPGNIDYLVKERVDRAKDFEPHYLERARPNGTIISVEGHPLSQGGWVSVYTDITAQKQHESLLEADRDLLSDRLLLHSTMLAETNRKLQSTNRSLEEVRRALTKSEQRMRIIAESMPAHIASLSPDYIYTYSNHQLLNSVGLTSNDIVGKSIPEVFGSKIFETIKPALDQALSGEYSKIEFEVPVHNGDPQIVHTTFIPETDLDGNVKGAFVLSLNITEQVRTMEALLESKRMETTIQLTSGLVHDFSNILTIIIGNLNRVEQSGVVSTGQRELIRTTQKAAGRAVHIIKQLSSFRGKQSFTRRVVNITFLLREICKLFSSSIPEYITLDLQLPDHDVMAFVDESALQDVLLNLLLNACDAVENNGAVFISAKNISYAQYNQEMVEISVSDNGCGFTEEALKRAYEPFYTTKKDKGGSGLGLSMARAFTSQSDGYINIQSTRGEGSTVTLTLPSSSNETMSDEEPGQINVNTRISNKSNIVMLVDDERDVRRHTRHILRNKGFAVIEAEDPEEALVLIGQIEGVDVILSDIIMPGKLNGLEMCNQIRKQHKKLPIILTSGLPDSHELIIEAKQKYPVISKPFNADKFLNLLSKFHGR